MLVEKFFEFNRRLMDDIERDEASAIEQAAQLIAEAVSKGNVFLIHDRGHLIGGELLSRAGGAVFVRRLDVTVPDPSLNSPTTGVRKAHKLSGDALTQRKRAFELEYLDYMFDVNGLREGDVLMLNSNSGYGFSAVAIAQTAKKKGLKLIVMSSKATSDAVTPEGGDRKLSEFADVLFDNHAPFGDAVFDVEGLDEKLWPASGMGAVYIAWPMVLLAVEKLLAMGVEPTVFRSVNIPGGVEKHQQVMARYDEKGY